MAYWERTKSNRLKTPSYLKPVDNYTATRNDFNWAGLPVANVGDFIHNQFDINVGAGTVGRLISINPIKDYQHGAPTEFRYGATYETLSGETKKVWLTGLTALSAEAFQEVKDYYAENNNPKKIKVEW